MDILCLGLSHHTTPVELRERLNYSSLGLKAALARFADGDLTRPAGFKELVILSTCNRLELYAVRSAASAETEVGLGAAFATLLHFLAETHNLTPGNLGDQFYRLTGPAASMHLAWVACGLDSMILGEPQILGQVTEAYTLALGQGTAGPVLAALFRAAIRAGKRARTETGISRNPATISSVAVKLAELVITTANTPLALADCQVLVVGAGEMAKSSVEALWTRGATQITVVNRTHGRALGIAKRWGARVLPFAQLGQALAAADIVISSTGAPHFVITPELAGQARAARPERPLVLMDIAVPRDVDPTVRHQPNVYYYDIDDLEAHLNGALAERQLAVPQVKAIASEELQNFSGWLTGLEIAPLIAGLHAKAELILRAEMDKTFRHLPDLTDFERAQIEILAKSVVNKLLHEPTRRLKAEAGDGHAAEYAAAVRALFNLEH